MKNKIRKIRRAIIPAAGFGTRFLPITKSVPKELLPIGNKPAIQYVVEEAVAAGIEEIVLVCHPHKTAIMDYFKPDPEFQAFLKKRGKTKEVQELLRIESLANFIIVYQEKPMGLGHAVWSARKAIGKEPFVVMLPDVLFSGEPGGIRHLLKACQEGEWGVILERVSKERVSSYGIVRCEPMRGAQFSILGAVEKPKPEKAPSNLSLVGRYLFPPEIFDLIHKSKRGALGEIQITDALDALARKKPGRGILVSESIFDVGTPEGLLQATEYFS